MATKYIVNTKKMAFSFQNGKVLERKGVLAVSEEELAELEKDYFFAGLKEKGVISVSLVKPSDFTTQSETIAADNVKITALEKEVAELKAKLAEAQATGKETATVIDSAEDVVTVTKKTSKKKSSKTETEEEE